MTETTYEIGAWDLSELFSDFDAPRVQDALDEIEERVSSFEAKREQLDPSLEANAFVSLLDEYEAIERLLDRLLAYAVLRVSEDTQNQRAHSFRAKMQQLGAEVENRRLFFKLWWKKLPAEAATRLLSSSGDYQYWLEALRLQTPYTLSEPEEKIINIKDVNGPSAIGRLYESMTYRYGFELEVDGETRVLTRGELGPFITGPDPDLRAKAYQSIHQVFTDDADVLGMMYQFIARDWFSEAIQLRGYRSPLSVRNLANDIPDEVVDSLLDVCRQNVGLFQNYFRQKANLLGMEKLRRYDLYAPISQADKDYPYPEAIELVFESYREFSPEIADLAQQVLDENHVDSEIRKAKQTGAYCMTVTPDLTPYVLASYQGKARDVATIAHELGHAVHSLLASDHTTLTQSSSLPLAETASTFGEMLVVDRLLAQDPAPEVQRDLLVRQLDDNYATIMRQAYFALFERDAHDAIQSGASVDDLSGLYFENLQDQFGDSIDLSDDFRVEWIEIPHIYRTPFYVYAYAFGQLLVLSLYQRYQQEGDTFKPAYLDILRAGGSAAPMAVLDRAGVDIRQPSFWQGGFDVIQSIVDRLGGLTG
ncbi:MAG: M3 family oligoendopeptidase [Anaerolineales bacterium]